MTNIELLIKKDKLKVLGSIIKINRINQNMSQQGLAEGICVPSYLSKIENGEVTPSLEMISDIFTQLHVDYNDDYIFIKNTKEKLESFFEELSLNGFFKSGKIFKEFEAEESKIIHSPLIVEYYLAKLAFYCGTNNREEYSRAENIIESIEGLLEAEQKHKFYFYTAIDLINIKKDYSYGRERLIESGKYKETGHLYGILSTIDYRMKSYYDSIINIDKALEFYYDDVNLINVALAYIHKSQLAYKLNSIDTAIKENIKAINYLKKISREDLLIHALISLCYYYIKSSKYEEAGICISKLKMLNTNCNESKLVIGIEILFNYEIGKYEKIKDILSKDIFSQANSMKDLKVITLFLTKGDIITDSEFTNSVNNLIKNTEGTLSINFLLEEILSDILNQYYLEKRMYKQIYKNL